MMSAFQRLKQINPKIKDLVNGYIRIYQNELFGEIAKENPYYYIPQLVNNHCILFYEIFTWYKKHEDDSVEFISDTEVKLKSAKWSNCMFESEITDKMCRTFSATFKIISFGDDTSEPDFCIGYAKGDTLEASIKNWNYCLGEEYNTNTSASWAFCDDELLYSADGYDLQDVSQSMHYSQGDLLRISFDFEEKKAKIYRNDEEQDCRDLTTTKLWIGISLFYKGSHVQMVEYKYD